MYNSILWFFQKIYLTGRTKEFSFAPAIKLQFVDCCSCCLWPKSAHTHTSSNGVKLPEKIMNRYVTPCSVCCIDDIICRSYIITFDLTVICFYAHTMDNKRPLYGLLVQIGMFLCYTLCSCISVALKHVEQKENQQTLFSYSWGVYNGFYFRKFVTHCFSIFYI